MVETWAACELRRLTAASPSRIEMSFFRSHDGQEVDFVLEGSGRRVVGIEVKLASRIRPQDLAGLRKLREALGDRMGVGVLAYGGREVVGIDRHTLAVPFGVLFGRDAQGEKKPRR